MADESLYKSAYTGAQIDRAVKRALIGDSILTGGAYGFTVNEAGHLILNYEGDIPPDYAINEAGHLVRTMDNESTIDLGRVKGDPGADGKTPTNEDIAEIVTLVLQKLPNGDEVSY